MQIFIPALLHTAENWSSACWRLGTEGANSTRSSAKIKGL